MHLIRQQLIFLKLCWIIDSAVIMWCSMTCYCIDRCNDWTHKSHLIAHPNGWAMRCLLPGFGIKLTVLYQHHTVYDFYLCYKINGGIKLKHVFCLLMSQFWRILKTAVEHFIHIWQVLPHLNFAMWYKIWEIYISKSDRKGQDCICGKGHNGVINSDLMSSTCIAQIIMK